MIDGERRKDFAAMASLLLLIGLYFWPILFGDKTLFFRDVSGLLYPQYHYLAQSLHQGIYPLWNPALFNGAPFLAAFAPGIFYPPVLIFLLDDFTFAYNLFNVAHYALFTLSVYALARNLGMSVGAALCSATSALLSGFFLSSIYFFLVLSWLPAVFLCFRQYAVNNKPAYFHLTVVCIALQLLCGPPETCIITLALIYLQTVLMGEKGRVFKRTLQLGAAVVLAIGLAAPQILSTMILIKETVRSGGLTFGDHAFWSLEPKILPTIILPKDVTGFMEQVPPDTFGFFQSFHMGVFAVLCLCVAPLFFRRKEIRFWFVVFVTGLFLALGKNNPLYEWIYNVFPLLKLFRYPEKFYIFSAFSQVVLVGYVGDELLQKPLQCARIYRVMGILGASIWGASYLVPSGKPLLSLALLLGFGVCVHRFASGRMTGGVLKIIFVFLIVFDLSLKHYMLVPMIDKKYFEEEPVVASQIKQDKSLFRVYPADINRGLGDMVIPPQADSFLLIQITRKERLHHYWGLNYGIEYPDGLIGMGMELQDVRLWGEMLDKSSPEKRARILRRGNVKYFVAGDETAIAGRVQTLDNVLPRAFLVPKARQGEDPKLLNTYYDLAFDPRQEVLLSEPVEANAPVDFAGQVDAIHYEANRVVIKSHQTGDGFLVLLDTWFPGWTATVDGRPEHIYRANHFYRAVKTGRGSHTVEFSFMAPGFQAGLFISGSTLCVLLAVMLVSFRKRMES